jgi:nucleotide-binding universal stress UspA family protein
MYAHILIPTDGSELAGKAVLAGIALAKRIGAKDTALTVLPPSLLRAKYSLFFVLGNLVKKTDRTGTS